jgi:tetratricopeptide (TPR) repeat protein
MAACCGQHVFADGNSEAQKLKDDALAVLKANSNRQASAAEYASCIYKLEQAQAILEKSGDSDSNLAQEVNTSLFWARKFSNVQVMNELDKLKGGTASMPVPAPKKVEPAKPPPPPPDKELPPEPPPIIAEAKKAFDQAEKFANSHASDDYAVALSWFKMANDYSGTDYALKALGLARAAQARFAAKSAPEKPKDAPPETPEMQALSEGDKLSAAGKFDDAINFFKGALTKNDTMAGHSKLAHAYFDRGQQMKDDLMPKMEQADKEYRDAYKNAIVTRRVGMFTQRYLDQKNPAFVAAKAKCEDLAKQSYKAIDYYEKAESEFKGVLRLAPDKKDFDAAGHVGLCLSVHGDINFRLRAQTVINQFLSDYTPTTDLERSLYEFCKTELARIRKL